MEKRMNRILQVWMIGMALVFANAAQADTEETWMLEDGGGEVTFVQDVKTICYRLPPRRDPWTENCCVYVDGILKRCRIR